MKKFAIIHSHTISLSYSFRYNISVLILRYTYHTTENRGGRGGSGRAGGGGPAVEARPSTYSYYTTSTSFGTAVLIHLPYQTDKPCASPNRRFYLGFLSQDTDRYSSVFVRVQASVLFQLLPISVVAGFDNIQGTLAIPYIEFNPSACFLTPDPDVQP